MKRFLPVILLFCACGSTSSSRGWPKTVSLSVSLNASERPRLRLSDGVAVSSDAEADVHFQQTQVLSLYSEGNEAFCIKGFFSELQRIPNDLKSCESFGQNYESTWRGRIYLEPAGLHTPEESGARDLSLLVKSRLTGEIYRMRILSTSYQVVPVTLTPKATVTVQYQPAR